MKRYKDKDWLEQQYSREEKSLVEIAAICNVGHDAIWYWMRKHNIPRRKPCPRGKHIDLSRPGFLDFLNGLILGDGCLFTRFALSARYHHSSKFREYLVWLSKQFQNFGVDQVGKINSYKSKQNGKISCNYSSCTYREFKDLHDRWYKNGTKIIPLDLELTPTVCLHWYIGDGCLHKREKRKPHIYISTYCFTRLEVEFLRDQLTGLGFKATVPKGEITRYLDPSSRGRFLTISTHSTRAFLDYIGSCPAEIKHLYNYKWDYQNNRKRKR